MCAGELGRTGTKEGCREGDCGACTMIVGELIDGTVQYKAVNSCIMFLPSLDEKQLITVEDLSNGAADLHPVQQAMVNNHSSQCGFCTPGFVMALYELYLKDEAPPSSQAIKDGIAGNLCRCTGYGPIINAAKTMHEFDRRVPADIYVKLKGIQRANGLELSHDDSLSKFGIKYFAPKSLSALLTLINAYPGATLLAGGTDVGLWSTKQYKEFPIIIDVTRVEELRLLSETETSIEVGAAVTYAELFETIRVNFPSFGELLRRLGSVQVRNSGTMGGNIANGSPIGDSMPPLIALGSEIMLASSKTQRTLPIENFFIDYGVQDLKPGEVLAQISIPKLASNEKFFAYKLSKRFDQDISACCLAVKLTVDKGSISNVRIGVGGLAATPKRALACESALEKKTVREDVFRNAMAALADDFAPISDMRASADYRLKATQNCLYKVFLELTEPNEARSVLTFGA